MGTARFSQVRCRIDESDLWIGWNFGAADSCRSGGAAGGDEETARAEVERIARESLTEIRGQLIAYGERRGAFRGSLEPLEEDPEAPPVVSAMLRSGRAAGVGPMAAVAGAIAEAVGRAVVERVGVREIVVENGGDLWIDVREPLVVSVYAGLSSLSETFGIVVGENRCPCGLACSSGTVGPSLSFGKADAAVVLSGSAAAADAWATALGNRVRTAADLESAVRWTLSAVRGGLGGPSVRADLADLADEDLPRGALAVLGDTFAAAGELTLAPVPAGPRRPSG